jgi:hypothetical protein
MKVEEIKKLMQAIDELETQFAQQKADYEARKEAFQAALYRMYIAWVRKWSSS